MAERKIGSSTKKAVCAGGGSYRQFFSRFLLASAIYCVGTAAFGWTLVADFESGAVGERANGPRSLSEAFSKTVIVDTPVFDGIRATQMGIDAGISGFGTWGGIIDHPVDLHQGSEIWFRVSTYFPTNFIAVGNPRLKFLRVHTLTTVGLNDGYLDLYILPNGQFSYDNEVVGVSTSKTPFGAVLKKGEWETYEIYIKLHSQPQAGIYRVWQNGKLIHENKTLKTLSTAASWSDRAHIFTYWNGNAPQTQSMYVDDVILTTDRPRCQDDHGNPMIGPAKSSAPGCVTGVVVR